MQQLVGTVIAFDCGRGLSSYISKESWPADRNGNTATPDGVPYDPVLMVVKNEHLEARGAPATTCARPSSPRRAAPSRLVLPPLCPPPAPGLEKRRRLPSSPPPAESLLRPPPPAQIISWVLAPREQWNGQISAMFEGLRQRHLRLCDGRLLPGQKEPGPYVVTTVSEGGPAPRRLISSRLSSLPPRGPRAGRAPS